MAEDNKMPKDKKIAQSMVKMETTRKVIIIILKPDY